MNSGLGEGTPAARLVYAVERRLENELSTLDDVMMLRRLSKEMVRRGSAGSALQALMRKAIRFRVRLNLNHVERATMMAVRRVNPKLKSRLLLDALLPATVRIVLGLIRAMSKEAKAGIGMAMANIRAAIIMGARRAVGWLMDEAYVEWAESLVRGMPTYIPR